MISARQKSIVLYIGAYTAEHGFSPSYKEIGEAVGLASTNAVSFHLRKLEESGYIVREYGKSRTIVLTALGKKLLPPPPRPVVSVPILTPNGLRVMAARIREKDRSIGLPQI